MKSSCRNIHAGHRPKAAIAWSIVLVLCGLSAAGPACSSDEQYADGVTVRKNADGSIEVEDSGSAPAPARPAAPRAKKSLGRTAKPGVRKYNDGVVVRKNADGSIEVTDSGSVPARTQPARRPAARRAPVTGTRRHSGGTTTRRNADGSVEVWDDTPVPSQ